MGRQADHVVLAHFSQRYSRLPVLPQSAFEAGANITVAFDLMTVHLDQLGACPSLLPLLNIALKQVNDKYEVADDEPVTHQEDDVETTGADADDDFDFSSDSSSSDSQSGQAKKRKVEP